MLQFWVPKIPCWNEKTMHADCQRISGFIKTLLVQFVTKFHEDGSAGSKVDRGQALACMLVHTHASAHAHRHKVG